MYMRKIPCKLPKTMKALIKDRGDTDTGPSTYLLEDSDGRDLNVRISIWISTNQFSVICN